MEEEDEENGEVLYLYGIKENLCEYLANAESGAGIFARQESWKDSPNCGLLLKEFFSMALRVHSLFTKV